MNLTAEQITAFKTAADPLVKWLNANTHPHCSVIVDATGAELLQGVALVKINDHIKD